MNTDITPSPNVSPFKHILAPVDFSKPCLQGLAAALDLARRFDAKLTLVHVVKHLPRGSHVVFDAVGIDHDWERPAREQLAEFVESHVPAGQSVNQIVVVGKPFHEVVRSASSLTCDLIVISTHGYTGLAHLLIGSNAERIVQYAPCPVLVMRGRTDETRLAANTTAFRWILLPTDFSENSRKAFPLAATMAREFDAKLTLAYVQPALALPDDFPDTDAERDTAAARSRAGHELVACCNEHLPADLHADTLLLEGVAHQAICAAAKSDDPGLIIMATQGQTGWKHALIGRTAERVVRHAPCPVLVVRPPVP